MVFACGDESTLECQQPWAQDTHQTPGPRRMAKHVCTWLARVEAHKANPSQYSHISSLSTKSTWYHSTAVHAQYCQPHAHVQTHRAFFLNKIYQTWLE